MSATIFVSGAGGFVGQALVPQLRAAGLRVVGLTRNTPCDGCDDSIVGDLAETVPDLSRSSEGDTFIHLAAKVHDRSADEDAFMHDTVQCAQNVARAITVSPIRRVVHLSSIGARIAAENERQARLYGKAKLAAEQAFEHVFGQDGGVCLVTLRPPAIYGPGAPGNFALLETFIRKGIPLPLGRAIAQRDYLFIDNLVELLVMLCTLPDKLFVQVGGKSFEPSDGDPVSTRDLVRRIAFLIGKRARTLPVPTSLLKFAGVVTGRQNQVSGALSPLSTRKKPSLEAIIGWKPRQSLSDGLARMYQSGKPATRP